MRGQGSVLVRVAGAGSLAGGAFAFVEAHRASVADFPLAWPDRIAVVATGFAVLLPIGLLVGLAVGALLVALEVEDDPRAWARSLWRSFGEVRASTLAGVFAGALAAAMVGVVGNWAVLVEGAIGLRAGLVVAGVALVAAAAGAVGFPVASLVRGLLGDRDRTTSGRLLLAAPIVVGASLVILRAAVAWREILGAVDWRVPGGIVIAGILFLGAMSAVRNVPDLRRTRVLAWLAGASVILSAWGVTALDDSVHARGAVLNAGGLLVRALAVAQEPFDSDGDGYAAFLGGADCDDAAAGIYPGADEIPGNGIDEDCSGTDLPLPPTPASEAERAPTPFDPVQVHARPSAVPEGGPVILISVDTLRYQNLGAYGYERPTSPNFDRLAAESIVFQRAYSTSSKTPTAMPSILTGRYPSELSRTYHHFHLYDESNRFLAEMLRDVGYRTGGVAAHWYFREKFGLHQGFDEWEVIDAPGEQMERMVTSEQVTDKALAMLERLEAGGNERFALMVHYFDPHKWYLVHEGFEPFGRKAIDRYDGEIRFTDHHFGRLLDAMQSRPWWDKATVAFYSDHGEAFGEHKERFHGWSLYEHETHVPFFLKVPTLRPGVVGTPVSLIDLVPTVLDIVGAPMEDGLRGTALVPSLSKDREWPARPIYTEMPPGPYNSVIRAFIDRGGRYKLVHRRRGNVYEVFDLQTDPAERHNLSSGNPQLLRRLQDRLQRFRSTKVARRAARLVPR